MRRHWVFKDHLSLSNVHETKHKDRYREWAICAGKTYLRGFTSYKYIGLNYFWKFVYVYACIHPRTCRCEMWVIPNHSNYKYLNIQFQFISLSLFLPFINHVHRFILLSCFLYLTSLFHMLTAWLGICWPPGSLNQSRASLTESAHTCPDRNDNDCGQSPPIFTVATVISLFWNAHSGVWGEVLHSDGSENAEPVSKEETLLSVQFHVNFTSPPDKSKHCLLSQLGWHFTLCFFQLRFCKRIH